VGTGWQVYQDKFAQCLPNVSVSQVDGHHLPTAKSVAQLACVSVEAGHVVSAEQALPVYLRDRVAEKPRK
jgi:tRNA threonylcarbamoyladenosine biosynthesis protein TsaB